MSNAVSTLRPLIRSSRLRFILLGCAASFFCVAFFFLAVRAVYDAQNEKAAALLELAGAPLSHGLLQDDARLLAWTASLTSIEPVVAVRLINADGIVASAGPQAFFEKPEVRLFPGFPLARYSTMIGSNENAARVEILVDSMPAGKKALGLLLACALTLACAVGLAAMCLSRAKKNGPDAAFLVESGFPAQAPVVGRDAAPPLCGQPEPEPKAGPEPGPQTPGPVRAFMSLRLRPLAPLFMQTAFDNARRMRLALAENDLDEIRRLGHSLKGAARTYGLSELGEHGFLVEEAAGAANADSTRLGALLDDLDGYLGRLSITFTEEEEKEAGS